MNVNMDAKEAILRIKEHNRIHQMKEPPAVYITEALNMAVAALEKQIPKPPIAYNQLRRQGRQQVLLDDYETYKCPTCGSDVVGSGFYCWNCGQRLDWGDKK